MASKVCVCVCLCACVCVSVCLCVSVPVSVRVRVYCWVGKHVGELVGQASWACWLVGSFAHSPVPPFLAPTPPFFFVVALVDRTKVWSSIVSALSQGIEENHDCSCRMPSTIRDLTHCEVCPFSFHATWRCWPLSQTLYKVGALPFCLLIVCVCVLCVCVCV